MAGAGLTIQKPITIFIVALLTLLIMMSYQVADETTGRTVLGNVIFTLLSPIQSGTTSTVNSVWNTCVRYFDLVNTNKKNQQLTQEVDELKIRLQASLRERDENQRLREILNLREKLPLKLVAGEVIGGTAKAPISRIISINRGTKDGVKVQMPVVTPSGIVGMIIEASPVSSKVQLMSDVSSSIGAMLSRNLTAGILSGTGTELCLLKYLPLNADIKVGDAVVSSGQDGIFPEGFRIGKVTKILKEELYVSAEVTPYQSSAALKEVVILLQTKNQNPGQNQ
jgi:rod shape-determining protein MreC